MNKKCIVIGGGTFNHVRAHLALAAPAFGETARQLHALCEKKFTTMDVDLVLTKMAELGCRNFSSLAHRLYQESSRGFLLRLMRKTC